MASTVAGNRAEAQARILDAATIISEHYGLAANQTGLRGSVLSKSDRTDPYLDFNTQALALVAEALAALLIELRPKASVGAHRGRQAQARSTP